MCRNIKRLRRPEGDPTDEELRNAALQYVRKISGFNAPSQANRDAFDAAVDEVAAAGRRLFDSLQVRHRASERLVSGDVTSS
jgi:hypothetical protein